MSSLSEAKDLPPLTLNRRPPNSSCRGNPVPTVGQGRLGVHLRLRTSSTQRRTSTVTPTTPTVIPTTPTVIPSEAEGSETPIPQPRLVGCLSWAPAGADGQRGYPLTPSSPTPIGDPGRRGYHHQPATRPHTPLPSYRTPIRYPRWGTGGAATPQTPNPPHKTFDTHEHLF